MVKGCHSIHRTRLTVTASECDRLKCDNVRVEPHLIRITRYLRYSILRFSRDVKFEDRKVAWPRKVPYLKVRYALLTPSYNPFQRASQRNRSNAPCGPVFVPFPPLINSLPYLESPAVQLHCAVRINLVQSIRHQIHFQSRVFVESLSNFILASPLWR